MQAVRPSCHERRQPRRGVPFPPLTLDERLVRFACGHTALSAEAAGETSRLQPDGVANR